MEKAITAMVLRALQLATTWVRWDGQPLRADGRDFTPHKAMRRIADHMVDHLAQLESHLAGVESLPDEWQGSAITTPCDLAPFGEEDLAEARSRLTRLAQLWRFAGAGYRVGNRYIGHVVGVRVVADTVQITQDGLLLRTHRARHDKGKEFGALANPGGRPRKAQDVA